MAKLPNNTHSRKRWFKPLLYVLIFLVVLPLILYGILRSSGVQTFLAGKITSYLSKELRADVRIQGVDISWFLDVVLEEIYIGDRHRDTLVYAHHLSIDVYQLKYGKKILEINNIKLEKARISISRLKSDSSFNLQFLVDYFSSPSTAKTPGGKTWKVGIRGLQLSGSRFTFRDDHQGRLPRGVDFSNLDLDQFNLILKNIRITGDTVNAGLEKLAFRERSGFVLTKLQAAFELNSKGLYLKDLQIRTPHSNLETDLSVEFNNLLAFNNFIDEVQLTAYFLPSDIHVKDLVFFVPELEGMKESINLSGEVEGKINNLKMKDFQFEFGTFTRFRGDVRLTGLPNLEETFIHLNVKEFYTNHYDIESLSLPGGKLIVLPEQLVRLGNLKIKGSFTGFYNDFVSYAQFNSAMGSVFTDISLKMNVDSAKLEYSGHLIAKELNLGKLMQLENYIGKLNLEANVTGSGTTVDDLLLNIEGVIDSVYLMGNRFNEIRLSGGFFNKKFNGSFQVKDEYLGLDFDGAIDLNQHFPDFDFNTRIRHASLNQLNLVRSDSMYQLATSIRAHFQGIDPDSITGSLVLDSTTLIVNHSRYFIEYAGMDVLPDAAGKKLIRLNSDYADASLKGECNFRGLIPSIQKYLSVYLPSLFSSSNNNKDANYQHFTFELDLKNPEPFSNIFFPSIHLAPHTTFSGVFNPGQNLFKLSGSAAYANLMGKELKGLFLESTGNEVFLDLRTGCDRLIISEDMGIDHLTFQTQTRNDTMDFALRWKNDNPVLRNTGDLEGYLCLLNKDKLRFHFNYSGIVINDSLWYIPEDNIVEIDTQSVKINNLVLVSGNEKMVINGNISKNPRDIMTVDFQRFDLSNIDFLTTSAGFDFDGYVNGNLRLTDLYHAPDVESSILISGFSINQDKLGNAELETRWNPQENSLFARAEVIYRGNIGVNKPLSVSGYYYPRKKKNSLDFTARIENFKLKTISGFLSSFSSRLNGFAEGNLYLKGTPLYPELSGKVKVQRGSIHVDYLNTDYSFNHEFIIGKDYISIDDLTIIDSLGNKAYCSGMIRHNSFSDFSIDINIRPQNTLVLNTSARDNSLFYGAAVATGNAHIYGPAENLVMDIAATTEKGTQFSFR